MTLPLDSVAVRFDERQDDGEPVDRAPTPDEYAPLPDPVRPVVRDSEGWSIRTDVAREMGLIA